MSKDGGEINIDKRKYLVLGHGSSACKFKET